MFEKLRKEDGASAVEFALLCPLLFMLIFGTITFGLAFMQLQTARGAVREGARTGAVYDGTKWRSAAEMEEATVSASTGTIDGGLTIQACTASSGEATVSYDTNQANGGQGISADLIFFTVPMNTVVRAEFLCEG